MKSLSGRFILWNGGFVLLILLSFGLFQWSASQRTISSIVDHDLMGRAEQVSRNVQGPPPNRGPNDNPEFIPLNQPFGQGVPDNPNDPNQPGQPGQQRPNGPPPQEGNPVERPRVLTPEGKPRDPNSNFGLWSESMFKRSMRGEHILSNTVFQGVEYRVASVPIPGRDRMAGVVQIGLDLTPYRVAQRAQLLAILAAIPLALLVAVLLGMLMAKLVLRPIRRLTEAAERIAAEPGHQEQIPVEQEDEIGRLSATFNAMTSRLQTSNHELAEALDQQRRFTSDAAHELRTPLTGIVLAAENGLHPDATPEEARAALQTVARSSQSMTKLTSLLLTLSRFDYRQSLLELRSVMLLPLVTSTLEELGLRQDARIKINLGPGDIVHANEDATKQILRNIIENAAAHITSEGAVRISFSGSTLSIEDTGIGIPAEHLPHLFERFYRVDPSRHRSSGGYGLGLAIVKSMVEAQGGEVTVESTVGQGTTFFIKFQKKSENS